MSRRVLRGFDAAAFATLRRERGFSVSDLARLSGVSLGTIHHWESGRRTPQIDILATVMTVLAAPIGAVVLIEEDQRFPGDWRVLKGLTQPQLAAQAQLSTAAVQRIELGEHPLSDANAHTLSGLLGISPQTYRDAYHRARQRPPGTSC
ncbi:helix-turn-helix transcriptional regulator [Mycobacterium hackensackense]|uniref:helix-turn-helix domain-containing protein n=1 Tax=Mycobacterium hackensackense TaxID=228909 RepID=UPI002265ED00|nr:helix-turn-helix domain-containing protein [Mycobacterium hackensackense]MCV7257007.1 helix-turn-helix transcriptional regulator [Mycobacterium hackensackense]